MTPNMTISDSKYLLAYAGLANLKADGIFLLGVKIPSCLTVRSSDFFLDRAINV